LAEWAGSEQTRESVPQILTQPISPQPIRPNAEWQVQSSSSLIMTPVVTSIGNANSQNDFGDIEVINSLFTDGMESGANATEHLCHHASCHLHRHAVACGRSPMCYPLLNSLLPRTYLPGITEHYSNNPILSMGLDSGNRSNSNMPLRSPPLSNSITKDKKIIPSPIAGNSQSSLNAVPSLTANEIDNTDNLGTPKSSSDNEIKSNQIGNNTNKWKEKQANILKPVPAIKKSGTKKSVNSSGNRNSKLNGVQILEIAQKLGQIPGLESIRWESLLDSSRKQDVSDKEISTRVQEAEILGSRLFGGDLEKLLASLLSQHLDFLVYFVRMSLSGDSPDLKDVREMLWRTLTAVREREEAEGEHSD